MGRQTLHTDLGTRSPEHLPYGPAVDASRSAETSRDGLGRRAADL